MLQVDVPYQTQADKLFMRDLAWPRRCVCCGQDNDLEHHELSQAVGWTQADPDQVRYHNRSLSWQVPYCATCLRHVRLVPNVRAWPYPVGFALWVGLGYLLFVSGMGETLQVIIFLALAAAIGFACYKLSGYLPTLIKRTPTCAALEIAIRVGSADQKISFIFHNDDYAAEFVRLNGG
jgi:hypothetical protein